MIDWSLAFIADAALQHCLVLLGNSFLLYYQLHISLFTLFLFFFTRLMNHVIILRSHILLSVSFANNFKVNRFLILLPRSLFLLFLRHHAWVLLHPVMNFFIRLLIITFTKLRFWRADTKHCIQTSWACGAGNFIE